MPESPLDPNFQRVHIYPGVALIELWRGMRQEGPANAVPTDQFRLLKNIRFDGQQIRARWGMSKENSSDSSDTSCITGTSYLDEIPTNARLIASIGFDTGNVELYGYFPEFNESTFLRIDPDEAAKGAEFIIKYKDNLYDNVGKLLSTRRDAGTFRIASSEQRVFPTPNLAQDNVGLITGSGSQMVVAPTLDDDREGELDLYFVSNSGVDGNEVLYSWNGTSAVQRATTTDFGSTTALTHVGYLNEQLFVVVSPAVEGNPCIYYRDFDGSWTAVNCPTLTQETQFTCLGITYYDDKALLHGWAEGSGGGGTSYGTVLVWNGSTLTLGTQTTQTGASESYYTGIYDATVYNGNYYYTWTDFSGGTPYLGRYNGTTFSNTQHDLSTPFDSGYGPVGIGAKGGLLLITAYDHGNDFNTKVYVTTDLSNYTELTIEDSTSIAIGPPHRVFTV